MIHRPCARTLAPALTACCLAATSAPVAGDGDRPTAPDPADGPARAPSILILGVASLPDYPGSDDHSAVPLVVSRFSLGRVGVAFSGTELSIDLVPGPGWSAGPLAGFARGRDEGVESARVAALPEIDAALELGAYVGFDRPVDAAGRASLSGSLSVRGTVSDEAGGTIARATLGFAYAATQRLRLGTELSASVADGEWTSIWFDVDAAASGVSSLRTFDASGGARDAGVSASAVYSFSQRRGVYAGASRSRLLGDAADSPVTRDEGDDSQWFGGVGLFWRHR